MYVSDEQRRKIADYVRNYLLRTADCTGQTNGAYRATARWTHTLNVLHNVTQILDGEQAKEDSRDVCTIAAMFHDIDHYTVSLDYHAIRGAETATRYLTKEGFPLEFVARVAESVREHDRDLDDDLPVADQIAVILTSMSTDARMVMDADTLDKIGASNIIQSLLTMGSSKKVVGEAAQELTSGWPLQRARLWKEMLTTTTGKALGERAFNFYEQFLDELKHEIVMTDPFPKQDEESNKKQPVKV